VRVPLGESRLQARLGEQLGDPAGFAAARHDLVGAQCLGDGGSDAHPGIQAVIWVLEDDLGVPAVGLQRRAAQRADVGAVEADAAACCWRQPEDGPPDR
jgi:hypothetical protein